VGRSEKENHFGRKSLTDSLCMPLASLIAAWISAAASFVLIVLIIRYLSCVFIVDTSGGTALLAVHPVYSEPPGTKRRLV